MPRLLTNLKTYRRKLLLLVALLVFLLFIQAAFPGSKWLQSFYSGYIFRPYQVARNMLFGNVPVSVGDILYFIAAFVLIAVNIRWIYFLVRFRSHKHYLGASLLHTFSTLTVVYLLFFIGWGGNYYKPSLTSYWNLPPTDTNHRSIIAVYDRFLIGRLNALSARYEDLSFRQVDKRAERYFQQLTDRRTRHSGLRVKPSIYGYFMQYLGIQGYYNPFTGEAQVNKFLPSYMLPFVVCHEMAHQSGIGAEDDANLLSYALCVSSGDKDFEYSAYFNLWLYTHNRMRRQDSVGAAHLFSTLNPISHSQVDTLRAIRRRYRSSLSEVSTAIYDEYLKLHNQAGGVDSYYGVVLSAWKWELQRRKEAHTSLDIP